MHGSLPPGVSRGPDGKFVASGETASFEAVEHQRSGVELSVPAADVGGQTGQNLGQSGQFEGVKLVDYDELIDRHEVATLIYAVHRTVTYISSTQTADGTLRSSVEFSASPGLQIANPMGSAFGDIEDATGSFTVERSAVDREQTTDLVGPHLDAVAYGPITDGVNGVGGAGTAAEAVWVGPPPGDSRDFEFDPRDDLFLNGTLQHANVSDAALHCDVALYHVYGISETA